MAVDRNCFTLPIVRPQGGPTLRDTQAPLTLAMQHLKKCFWLLSLPCFLGFFCVGGGTSPLSMAVQHSLLKVLPSTNFKSSLVLSSQLSLFSAPRALAAEKGLPPHNYILFYFTPILSVISLSILFTGSVKPSTGRWNCQHNNIIIY